jgi:DNA-nicking Smr family endonuclease
MAVRPHLSTPAGCAGERGEVGGQRSLRGDRREHLPDDLMDEPDPIILPIEDSLDLHAFAPRDVPSLVDEYLRAAVERGFREVRVIHGRGQGVQRAVVQRLLAGHPLVERFFDAPSERGGWGATVVVLAPGDRRPAAS